MKLKHREDIDAPATVVWAMLADFDHWERAAMRRGTDVQRLDTLAEPAPGMGWKLVFAYRGKERTLTARLAEIDPGQRMGFTAASTNVSGTAEVDLVEMGPRRTRMTVTVDAQPRTLAARLVMQGLRLARGRVDRRFADSIAALATHIEDRHHRKTAR